MSPRAHAASASPGLWAPPFHRCAATGLGALHPRSPLRLRCRPAWRSPARPGVRACARPRAWPGRDPAAAPGVPQVTRTSLWLALAAVVAMQAGPSHRLASVSLSMMGMWILPCQALAIANTIGPARLLERRSLARRSPVVPPCSAAAGMAATGDAEQQEAQQAQVHRRLSAPLCSMGLDASRHLLTRRPA